MSVNRLTHPPPDFTDMTVKSRFFYGFPYSGNKYFNGIVVLQNKLTRKGNVELDYFENLQLLFPQVQQLAFWGPQEPNGFILLGHYIILAFFQNHSLNNLLPTILCYIYLCDVSLIF